ncbi:guanine nucleotide exchange factor [Encephalitozoon hellem ATCC 50504]|uniref:Importin subunit beta-4 n=1 Tax=Encephalitozoon hellem TaxID=27973 RepID=A0A9Q9CE17_ENCHE|nr:guanine nucleotide exchange factor [Encephalitozoon hellem ATCC 50504]AFM99208.1 guanine nucleotide exchange factor [Encephalitozoon hellem ATCC 50504]UTX44194.1 importin subunit beta-4 [Encephalitozoon hellem]WEL39685.1 putative transportin [Encephalitozoon hellem]|eukprot:XP_003888189.1 guanine nucleotide exchange factor [Encephalitozoon hellem ATCC 50504]
MGEGKQKLREVQILLHRLLGTSNKEIRRVLDELPASPTPASILDVFRLLFSLAKYSNREMLCFLDAFQRFIFECHMDIGDVGSKIVDLKFTPSEKDTDSAILKYFEVINMVAEKIPQEPSRSVFSRYMFILSHNVVSKGAQGEVLARFRAFLEKKKELLRLFADRKMYKDIGCTEDLVLNFCDLFNDEEMVGVALECTSLRGLVINRTRSRYLFQIYYRDLPKWYMIGLHDSLIPYLYYAFDGVGIYRNVCEEVYNGLSAQEIMKAIDEDMRNEVFFEDCDMFTSNHGCKGVIQDGGAVRVREDIRKFNETGCLDHMFESYGKQMSFEILRYFEETDLKKLGAFLCKLKNEACLRIFADTFDFTDVDVLDGLRTFLLSFYLSAEGQVIHRVVEAYADKYYLDNAGTCTFMEIDKDNKTKEFVFNLSFSFLVLNTKFHNPNIKVKPTFKDYMKDFTAEEIPPSFGMEYLESMYQSIKKKPLEFPVKNKPGKDHYKAFKRMCKGLKEISDKKKGLMTNSGIFLGPELPGDVNICTPCKMDVYRKLFSANFRRFFLLEPKQFYEMCSKLGMVQPFEEYLEIHKEDTLKFMESFVHYFEMEGSARLYATLLDVLSKIDKQRSNGMLSDLGISFLKSSPGKDRIQQQYRDAYQKLSNAGVCDVSLLCNGLRIFLSRETPSGSCSEEDAGLQKRKQKSIGFVKSMVIDILKKNIGKVEDVSMFDDESIISLLRKCVDTGNKRKFVHISKFCTDESLLGLFRHVLEESPGFIDNDILEVFKGISTCSEDGFRCILLLQNNGFDMFDFVATVKYESIVCRAINAHEGEDGEQPDQSKLEFSAKDTLKCYTIEERYEKSLSDPSSLFHFYVSSGSVLNQSKVRQVHKSGCPLKEDMFRAEEMDKRLIYLIKKADAMASRDITNYTLWIVNLLSSSLPLLSRFFLRNFGLLLTLKDQAMANNFVKIFYSRVHKVMNGSELCCSCGYSLLNDVEGLIEMLQKYDLASEKDFEFYFNGKRKMMKNGGVRADGRDVVIVRAKRNEGNVDRSSEDVPDAEKEDVGDKIDTETKPDFHL